MVEIIIEKKKKQIQIFIQEIEKYFKLELVKIPQGSFIMGLPESEKGSDNDERPQHKVDVKSFLMGRYPVTQAQWRYIAQREDLKVERELSSRAEPSRFKGDNLPVERVSWYEAVEFCARLSKLTSKNYRLPSEAEWEYACRAVTIDRSEELTIEEWNKKYARPFHFGETITTDLANYDGNYTYGDGQEGIYREKTTAVGEFPANEFGLHDMHGNVWEWCQDDWHNSYEKAPSDGSAWIDKSAESNTVVIRGGSWLSIPDGCRCATRSNGVRAGYDNNVGFRLVCVIGRDS